MPALRDVHTQLDLVLGALRRYPDREAFRQDDRGFTYREIADLLGRWGAVLARLGVGERGGVGLLSPNRPEVWLGQVAPGLVGGRYTALHPLGSLEDHLYMVREAELRVLLIDPAYAERGAQLLERSGVVEHVLSFGPCEVGRDVNAMAADAGPHALPASAGTADQLSWLLYTGGTTGVPKAAMLTEGGLGQMILNVSTGWDLPSERRYLAVAPISHAAGMMVTPTLMRGGTVVLQKGWDPQRWLDLVARERITMSLLVPTMIYSLLDAPGLAQADLATLETIMYGASPMSPSRLVEGIERIGPVFSQLYGQTECYPVSVLRKADHDPRTPELFLSCGFPISACEVKILDDSDHEVAPGDAGEICVRAPHVMAEYWKRPETTAETLKSGWLHTGDIARADERGYMFILDRKKDMIVSGGFNIFPREVEDVLTQHADVAMCAVVGVPDEKWGEAVTAVVVAREGARPNAEELIALVKAKKGAAHAPKQIQFVKELPMTGVGKVDKKVLKASFWAGRERMVG